MKKILLVVFAVLVGIAFLQLNQPKLLETMLTPSPRPSPVTSNASEIITFNNQNYAIYFQKVDPAQLSLIPNFSEKKSVAQIAAENSCRYGINGGFYTPENEPIGLFYSGEKLSEGTFNSFLNGFVYGNTDELILTNGVLARDDWRFAFQSGPLVYVGQKISIRDDEPARRMVLAEADEETHYFIALTEEDNTNSGPYLADVPQILEKISVPLTRAINLDGGSASAFISPTARLGEITPIGSFLCGK